MSRTYEQLEPVISALDERIKTNLGAFPTDTAEGSIASFADGADDLPLKSLVVNINPVQDLHGYDSPWVGGGGKNLLKPVETTVTSNGIVATGYEDGKVTVTGTATSDVQVELFLVSVAERRYYLILKDDINGSADTWWVSISGVAPIYSGHVNSTNFNSAGNHKLRINVKSGITINQTFYPMVAESETTYVPYENICPISGWTGCNVQRTGFNVWDEEWELGYFDTTGAWITNPNILSSKNPISVLPNTTYYLHNGSNENTFVTYWKEAVQPGTSAQDKFISRTSGTVTSFTTPNNCHYIHFNCASAYGNTYKNNICINRSDPAKNGTYESSHVVTIPIDWQTEAGTVYGGHLDVLSGVLTVDRAMVDLGTLDWAYDSVYQRFLCNSFYALGPYQPANNDTVALMVCDKYATRTDNNTASASYDSSIGLSITKVLHIRDTRYNDKDAFKASLSGTYLVFKLAGPTTVQLTPHEVRSLLGQNNIFADTGDTEVEYRADTKLYIERLTEPDADMIADANIVSGSYFMVGNTLYKATANIASGSAVIEGTNCTQKSLSEALNEINQ